jgi:hypothetical protein
MVKGGEIGLSEEDTIFNEISTRACVENCDQMK